MINISLHTEYIFSVGTMLVSNTLATSFAVTLILLLLVVLSRQSVKTSNNIVAAGLRVVIFELLRLIDATTQDRALSKRALPLVATFFLFIITANLLALVPGFLGSFFVDTPEGQFPLFRSPNSDLNTTIALAIIAVFSIQFFSFRALGMRNYLKRFFNFTGPIRFILGFFEMISEGVKVLSFSFRLFGNIFAGEVLLLVIAFLVPYLIPLPFMILEVFVGAIQAFIFAMLTLTFIKTSIVRDMSET